MASLKITSLWDIMQIEGLADLIRDQSLAAGAAQAIASARNPSNPALYEGEWLRTLQKRFRDYEATLQRLGAHVGARQAARAADALDAAKPIPNQDDAWQLNLPSYMALSAATEYLMNSLQVELELKKFIVVHADKMRFLEDDFQILPAEVLAKFPSLVPEAHEASQCFGLNRWTASVFHTVRCLEAGIRALCRCLGIPDPTTGPQRNWSNILRTVEEKLKEKWPTPADRHTDEYLYFDRIFGALKAFANPYRNETMHLAARYDEAEAAHIIEMVKGFLGTVAKRCDETGAPLA